MGAIGEKIGRGIRGSREKRPLRRDNEIRLLGRSFDRK